MQDVPLRLIGDETPRAQRPQYSRRGFLVAAAMLTGMLSGLCALAARAAVTSGALRSHRANPTRTPVVGYHMDHPYFDASGLAEPYLGPSGVRSGESLTELAQIHPIGLYGYC